MQEPVKTSMVMTKPAKRRSRFEERYEREQLIPRLQGGRLVWYAYESMKFKLADGTYYKPDFCMVTQTGRFQAHEVKGHMREAGRARLRMAAALYPWCQFYLVNCDSKIKHELGPGEWFRYEPIPAFYPHEVREMEDGE